MSNSPLQPPVPERTGARLDWAGLHGAALSLATARAARETPGLTLVVTPDTESAYQTETELTWFLGDTVDSCPIIHFPDWETLAYDQFSPHEDIVSQRLSVLSTLRGVTRGVLIVPVTTLMHRIAPLQHVAGLTFAWSVGDVIDVEAERRRLVDAGYRAVDTVVGHGEFCVRGSVLDVFPMGADAPLRLDLMDDELESLRVFDPDSQRTRERIDAVELLPAREVPLNADAIAGFRRRWHEQFDVDVRRCPVYQDVSGGGAPAGIEYYLPLFFDSCATLFDYLPDDVLALVLPGVRDAAQVFGADVRDRYENLRHDVERPILEPDALFLGPEAVFERVGRSRRVQVLGPDAAVPDRSGVCRFAVPHLPDVSAAVHADQPLEPLLEWLTDCGDRGRVLFTAETGGRREVLERQLVRAGLQVPHVDGFEQFLATAKPGAFGIAVGGIERALHLPEAGISVIPEAVLLGRRVLQSRRRKDRQNDNPETAIRSLMELTPGVPVVHNDHGVGRYEGLVTMELDGQDVELLHLRYADDASLYVPVAALDVISRYTGADPDHAPLHRLGSDQWDKARRKAAEKVRDVAAELLNIYARREAGQGLAFSLEVDDEDSAYHRFTAEFPFEETPDQTSAIEAVLTDLRRSQPMDRLVCGDVGFGKTEVAMRAAFVAVQSGYQVAVLVPTTLLAQQHHDSFCDRFANWPVRVEQLSRFTADESVATLAALAAGKVDIVIGTHRLIQDDVKFARLGLVIIDEEHRFGVRQKERFKNLRAEVDVLTLTATPIPRTLNLAVHDVRDLSIIATPPARRLSIKTFVRQRSDGLVREAIQRELRRGGQVYFLHNVVRTIEHAARELRELVPHARVGIAHGQMRESELELVMADFYHRRLNVLVCSTIIETGIDVPNANTIIMDRADRLGLAQLHQLRGRVGRSHHQAYAYLLTPHPKAMTTDAKKRLEAIEAAGELGAGFQLATHDLEIRGAGELLGEEQTGQIQSIGFTLYMDMLARAVADIRAGRTPDLDQPLQTGVEINLHGAALIPADYVPDVNTRLILYKRIAGTRTEDELSGMRAELYDRFGPLPEPTARLLRISALRQTATAVGIVRIDAHDTGGRVEFSPHTSLDPLRLITLIQSAPDRFSLEDSGKRLRFRQALETIDARFEFLEHLLASLTREDAGAAAQPASNRTGKRKRAGRG